jgi:hypothetical protein
MERTMQHGALVLRLALGTMFIAHALLKYCVFTCPERSLTSSSAELLRPLGVAGADPGAPGRHLGACRQRLAVLAHALIGDGAYALTPIFRARKLPAVIQALS